MASRIPESVIAGVITGAAEGIVAGLVHHFFDLSLRDALLRAIPVAVICGVVVLVLLHRTNPSRLTWNEISSDLRKLVGFAHEFHPDLIVGVNRGGAIVGGIVAKQLQLDCSVIYLLRVTPLHAHHGHGYNVTEYWSSNVDMHNKRVLLVDDAKRTGGHMKYARDYLLAKCPDVVIGTTVLLELSVHDPGGHVPAGWSVNMAARSTDNARLLLPWDK
jgi:hypoxanthine phosphoribosyltransferase/uncharacterized membrane protein YeaQ/YmgE (transglycosylase-associated protein family)